MQAKDANPLQRLAGRGARSFQVVGGEAGAGRLENRLELLPGVRVRASAACAAQSRKRTTVTIDEVVLELFGLRRASLCLLPWLWLHEYALAGELCATLNCTRCECRHE